MPKLLGIVGSPRRGGNTDWLVRKVLEGAAREGAETELISLAGLRIAECDGCHACWRGTACSKRDDMNSLYSKLAASDILVFGTPVYWYGPTALMKGFIDRFVYFNCPEHRPLLRGKIAAVVAPFEETDPETVRPVLDFFARTFQYLELKLAGELVAPGNERKGAVLEKPDLLDAAVALGAKLGRIAGESPK